MSYPPFAVTVDIALFTIEDDVFKILLIERGGEPYRGDLALPGGFVLPDEDLDAAAARELKEETGLAEGAWHLEQLAAYGDPATGSTHAHGDRRLLGHHRRSAPSPRRWRCGSRWSRAGGQDRKR